MSVMTTYRVTSPYFVAGFCVGFDGRVAQAAPIIYYVHKIGLKRFLDYAKKKKWTVEVVDDNTINYSRQR